MYRPLGRAQFSGAHMWAHLLPFFRSLRGGVYPSPNMATISLHTIRNIILGLRAALRKILASFLLWAALVSFLRGGLIPLP